MKNLETLTSDPRVTIRRAGTVSGGKCVVYWMQRSQRALDNPALDVAVEAANILHQPVVAFLAPVPFYPNANLRHYAFLMQGLPDIATGLKKRNVGFVLRRYPQHRLLPFCEEAAASLIVGDENPLREPERWREVVASQTPVPFWTVDSDVVVPTKLLEKQQFAARTIRPRIHAHLAEFLKPLKNPPARISWTAPKRLRQVAVDSDITKGWEIDRSVLPVADLTGGTRAGLRQLSAFIKRKLPDYADARNHPELDGTSRLSPYLHFGHLGPHTVALAVKKSRVSTKEREAFLEQLIVRRELAINFARFNPDYESFGSAPQWALRTLAEHANDEHPVLYSEQELENAKTHDPLWNAAQTQMVLTGWMHNYMRMYWAKKILEWSPSPAVAYQRAVRLNDKYELDGRDPNGYEGIAWSIVGKSDRPWFERRIFGKIRYMSFESTSRKFDSQCYIARIAKLHGKTDPGKSRMPD